MEGEVAGFRPIGCVLTIKQNLLVLKFFIMMVKFALRL